MENKTNRTEIIQKNSKCLECQVPFVLSDIRSFYYLSIGKMKRGCECNNSIPRTDRANDVINSHSNNI